MEGRDVFLVTSQDSCHGYSVRPGGGPGREPGLEKISIGIVPSTGVDQDTNIPDYRRVRSFCHVRSGFS